MGSDRLTAPVFSLQHFCLHDGPGIRSLVFFKGCPLRCAWCQNPESWRPAPEIGFREDRCIGCGACIEVCPTGAAAGADGACTRCFACVDRCPTGARVRFGQDREVSSLLADLAPEFPLMADSGGGVTLSGGEPVLHAAFARVLTSALQERGVHVALSTCGFFAETDLGSQHPVAGLLLSVDLILFDLKVWDPDQHVRLCKRENRSIRENFTRLQRAYLDRAAPPVWPRIPLVPGITDTRENLTQWAGFLRDRQCGHVTVVPYHDMGANKRQWLGLDPSPIRGEMGDDGVNRAKSILAQQGIVSFSPGEEAWEIIDPARP
ncbi:MAG: glycyl-radical enzyme activating protein [Desulfobacterales bacterium]|nr:glycyl-radical enzyme activating protein [Desulfobacterales bacterium]